jgi:hypothetical protein
MIDTGAMAGWRPGRFEQRMDPAQARAAGFGDARARRFRSAGFGAVPQSTGDSDLDQALDRAADLETRILSVRAELVRAGVKMGARGQKLPDDAVAGYNQLRSKAAQAVATMVEQLISQVQAIPFIGEGRAASLRQAVNGNPGPAFLDRVPLLPRELVSAPSASNPPLAPQEASFGNPILVPLGWGIAIVLAGIGVWIAAKGIAGAFNGQAANLEAEAERLKAWGQSQSQLVDSLKAAGVPPDQIADALAKNKPPPPPDGQIGLGAVLLALCGAAAVGAAVYYGMKR